MSAASGENYIDTLAGDIGLIVPDCPLDLLRLYALLALVKGDQVTLEDVHNAWAVWRAASAKPGHPALVPFGELARSVQELDSPYADAIRRVASHVELPDGELITVSRADLRELLRANIRCGTEAQCIAHERLKAAAGDAR